MTMKRLEHYICVISGAATGMGEASAKRFADEGAIVLCADIDEERAKKTVEDIQQAGGRAEAYHLDVSKEKSVKAFAEKVKRKYRTIDFLFKIAGIDRKGGKVMENPVEAFDVVIMLYLGVTFL